MSPHGTETASKTGARHGQMIRYLGDLEAELRGRGLVVVLDADRPVPRLYVGSQAAIGGDNVLAAPGKSRSWWYWWPWCERIAPADQPALAAEMIIRTLTTETGAGPQEPAAGLARCSPQADLAMAGERGA
jgi:hypothetical protein